jgi:hypothetical protein
MPVSGIGMHVCGPTIHDCGRKSKQSVQAPCLPACMLLYLENSLQNASKSRRRILEYSRTTMPNPSPTHGGILLKRSYKPEYRLPFVQPNLNTPHPVTPYPSKEQTTKPPRLLSQRNPRPNVSGSGHSRHEQTKQTTRTQPCPAKRKGVQSLMNPPLKEYTVPHFHAIFCSQQDVLRFPD